MRFMLVIACSLTLAGVLLADDLASVKIVVSDYFGSRLKGVDIRLTHAGKITTTRDDEPILLPYGEYDISLRAPGFSMTDYAVKIDQTQQVLVLAMKLGGIEGTDPVCSIKGKIISSQAVARVRLSAIFSPYTADVAVSGTGAYAFRNIQCGDYFVMAFDSKDCIGAQRVRVTNAESLADLRFNAPSQVTGCPLPKQ